MEVTQFLKSSTNSQINTEFSKSQGYQWFLPIFLANWPQWVASKTKSVITDQKPYLYDWTFRKFISTDVTIDIILKGIVSLRQSHSYTKHKSWLFLLWRLTNEFWQEIFVTSKGITACVYLIQASNKSLSYYIWQKQYLT